MVLSSPAVLSLLLLASLTGLGCGCGGGGEADDLRLFRRAALEAASAREAEAAGPPKAAFLFLTNSDLTFAPL